MRFHVWSRRTSLYRCQVASPLGETIPEREKSQLSFRRVSQVLGSQQRLGRSPPAGMNRNLAVDQMGNVKIQAHQSWKSVAELVTALTMAQPAEPAEHANQHPARTGADVGRPLDDARGRLRMQLQGQQFSLRRRRVRWNEDVSAVTQTTDNQMEWCRCRRPHGCWPTLGPVCLLGTCFERGRGALSQGRARSRPCDVVSGFVTYWPWSGRLRTKPPALRIDRRFGGCCAWNGVAGGVRST